MTLVAVMEVDLFYELHSHDCQKCNKRHQCPLPMCTLVWIPLEDTADLPTLGEKRLCNSCKNQLIPGHENRWAGSQHCRECGSDTITSIEQRAKYIEAGKRPPPMPHDQWCFAELDT